MAEPTPPPSQDNIGFPSEQSRRTTPDVTSTATVEAEPKSTQLEESQLVTPSPSLSNPESDSLFVPPYDDNEFQINDAPEESDPVIKQESTTPPPACIDIASNTDDEFPTLKDLMSRPRSLERGSETPKRPRERSTSVISAEDASTMLHVDDMPLNNNDNDALGDEIDPEAGYYNNDSDDGLTEGDSSYEGQDLPQKEKKPTQGLFSMTAREWHRRIQNKLRPSQIRNAGSKRARISKIRAEMKEGKRKRRKLLRKDIDPTIFLKKDFRLYGQASPRVGSPDEGGQPEVESATKKDWWKIFLEQDHTVDLHKCRGDWNNLNKKTKSFGYKKMRPAANGKWQLSGMKTCKSYFQVSWFQMSLLTCFSTPQSSSTGP